MIDDPKDLPEPAEFTSGALGDDENDFADEAYELGFDDGFAEGRTPARGVVNGFLLSSIFWIMLGLLVFSCRAQAPATAAGSGMFNYGYVEDSARVMLEQTWDTRNPNQVERAYCIEPADVTIDTVPGTAVEWHVHHVSPPDSLQGATPYSVVFACSSTAISTLHIHTPTSCAKEPNDPTGAKAHDCIVGGPDAYVCTVDEWDRFATTHQHDPFSIVQCDKHAFIFYFAGGRRG